MCICDDLMTVSRNHRAQTYLFDNRNWIMVATCKLQECLKRVHLGDLFFNFFFRPNRNWILVATRELQKCLKSVHLGDLFLIFFRPYLSICDDLMTVFRNHIADT